MIMLGFIRAVPLAVALILGAQGALAKTELPRELSCAVASVTGAESCAGIYSGNNSNSDLNGLFGVADWGKEYKIDSDHGSLSFGGTALTVSNRSKSWSLEGAGTYANLMFVLKGGNSYSAFLMDTSVLSGSWDTQSMLKGNGKRGPDLSHWSVYTQGTTTVGKPGVPSAVPLPAGVGLLMAALGGLGLMRRRKAA
ncbi:hypothetical protein P775_08945 [Puniceibacterium antarcticum]|uniref:VPLPA-CTERM protein sorting domain-containing protein n=1 Tax=Puniceibacterium antarcticum TaxID=1206336 RepID=A0A2G8RGL9_9RHOB|nr:VPLPA-CTERM sorting domain-containing protein [Puniceibacterium antarcticum]PIL20643.1 hypothetical protein P775_08945 [Puniceibacterium antarcticum]